MSEQTSNPTSGQSVPKSRKSKFRQKSQQQKTAESKLRMERRGEKLDAARKKLAKQKPLKTKGPVRRVAGVAGRGVHGFVHGKIYEVEHENVGTEGAHRTELAGETVLRHGTRFVKKQVREHPARAVRRAESRHTKATADYYYRKTVEEHPEMQKGGALSRYLQKQKIKRQYAKQVREAAKQGGKTAEKAVSSAGKLTEKVVAYAKEHPVGLLAAALCLILLLSLQSCLSSMTTVGNGLVGAVAASTYPSEDADMLGAEAAYCAMDKNQGYEIIKAVMLENGRGFALGHHPTAPSPYVTWACYDDKDGQRQYEWGHYGSDRAALEQDFAARVQEYQRLYNVGVRQTEAPGLYKYYSTQRPVDIGTFPKPPRNAPDEIVNYDQRVPVENGSFLAWGHLTYTRPLTKRQASDYELRPAPDNPDRPRSIREQMKTAAKQAEADRGQSAPKKNAPDRGDR